MADGIHIRVCCYNVFTGSPIPYVRSGTPRLEGSSRFRKQLQCLEATQADAIVLNEVNDGDVFLVACLHF
jgi:hypothetical protein